MISRQLINDAETALWEIYGMVPKRDRKKYADGHLKTVKTALTAVDKLIGQMNEIERLAVMARRDLELVAGSQSREV